MFEYSLKGLPHALVHAPELVETGGHHGAYCTCLAEAEHKVGIKEASQFSRTYGSLNTTQDGMFEWVLRQIVYDYVFEIHEKNKAVEREQLDSPSSDTPSPRTFVFSTPLKYVKNDWNAEYGIRWGSTLLSKKVLVTREEFIMRLRSKLGMAETRQSVVKLLQMSIRCYGGLIINRDNGTRRKVVGIDSISTLRRDFVRLKLGTRNGTAQAAQVARNDTALAAQVAWVIIFVIVRNYTYTNSSYTCNIVHI